MPVNLPSPADSPMSQANDVRMQLVKHLPLSIAERHRLERHYCVVADQVTNGVLPCERAAEAFVEIIHTDETLSWLIENTLAPTVATRILGTQVGAVDPGQAVKAVSAVFWSKAKMGWKDAVAIASDATASPPVRDWNYALLAADPDYFTKVMNMGAPAEVRQRDYEFKVATQRRVFAHELIEGVCARRSEELADEAKSHLEQNAQSLATIVVDGYLQVKPSGPEDAALLVDHLKRHLEQFLPICVGLLMQEPPKRSDTPPPTATTAMPITALSGRRASDIPSEAMRWHV